VLSQVQRAMECKQCKKHHAMHGSILFDGLSWIQNRFHDWTQLLRFKIE